MDRALRLRLLYLGWLTAGVAVLAIGWYALGGRAAAPPPQRYVEGVVGEAARINPLFAPLNDVDADLAALLFDGLVRIGGDGTPLPDLAERWEVTPDGLTYTFYLRPNVFWHDGERLDSRDVAFTIAQVQAPGFRGPPELAARWEGVTVSAVGPLTVVVRLPVLSPSFLAHATLGVLPEHLLAGLDPAALFDAPFNGAPVGTGPYRLVRLDGRAALLERNTSYYAASPTIDEFELRFFRDGPALLDALRDGAIDAALLGEVATAAERDALDARPELEATTLVRSEYTLLYLNNRRDPLHDPRLRSAIAASIDRAALLEAATGGRGAAVGGPIAPGSWASAPPERQPQDAGALFEAAGWLRNEDGVRVRDGRPLALEIVTNAHPVREALAEAVAEQLRARGVAATVTVMPSSELVAARLEPRRYDLAVFGWETGLDPDPYGAWHTSQIAPPGRNVAGYNDPAADALLEAARLTLDVAERRDLYSRFADRFAETAPSVVLYYPARAYVHPSALRGLSEGVLFEPASRFRDVHLWRLEPAAE